MKQVAKNIIKSVLIVAFLIFWFPILMVKNGQYEWVNNIADVARLVASIVGAFVIFKWIIVKAGLEN